MVIDDRCHLLGGVGGFRGVKQQLVEECHSGPAVTGQIDPGVIHLAEELLGEVVQEARDPARVLRGSKHPRLRGTARGSSHFWGCLIFWREPRGKVIRNKDWDA
eukprot:scaffold481904_cov36-Prasinocladus_malaysianus.AAC.1